MIAETIKLLKWGGTKEDGRDTVLTPRECRELVTNIEYLQQEKIDTEKLLNALDSWLHRHNQIPVYFPGWREIVAAMRPFFDKPNQENA